MDLISAKIEAAKESKKTGAPKYVIVDDEGECDVVDAPLEGVIHLYKNGSEVALSSELATKTPKAEPKTRKSKAKSKEPVRVSAEEELDELLESNPPNAEEEATPEPTPKKDSKKQNKETMATKTKKVAPKKAAKKTAPVKKATVKKVLKPEKLEEPIKAQSIAAGVKAFLETGSKKGILDIKGKIYAINRSASWAVRKSAVEAGKDGIIMWLDGPNGYYCYPKTSFKDLFAGIFKSATWEKIGIYSQSTLPKAHGEYFTRPGK